MALKDILVVVDDTPSVGERIEVALALATDHDAHLTGLYASPPMVVPSYVETYMTDALRVAWQSEEDGRAVRLGDRFSETVRRAGWLDRSDWRVVRGFPTDVAALHARTADLVVVGQLDPGVTPEAPVVEPESLMFECGRPVLLVPYAGRFPTVGHRVLVGWNGAREAARAVADALPLLERARMVTLLAVNTASGYPDPGDEPGADIARHLARHGITAEASHFISEPHEVGDTLLNTATDLGCDLIVMGGYGRSRLRAMVLGSLTGFMLGHMTVPVLMSH